MKSVTTMKSLGLHAASKVNLDDWVAYRCEIKELSSSHYFEVVGAICPVYVRGKKKGEPNYSKADKATERIINFTPQEHDVFVNRWELENKLCMACQGIGEVPSGWRKDKEANYRQCDRCNGSGK